MKSKITDHDFEFQVAKIIKWLQKENFVAVKIKTTSDTTSQDAERLKENILKEVQNNEDILGDRMSRLTIVCQYQHKYIFYKHLFNVSSRRFQKARAGTFQYLPELLDLEN